ncbi:MAG: hypothetical protein AAGE84_07345 [Cyanobacteria bacterium P01_G01_bin.39]
MEFPTINNLYRDDGFYVMADYVKEYNYDLAVAFSMRRQTVCCHPIKSYIDSGIIKKRDKKEILKSLKNQTTFMKGNYVVRGERHRKIIFFEILKINERREISGRLIMKLIPYYNNTLYADFIDEYYFDHSIKFSGKDKILRFNKGFREFQNFYR